jgi:hypothetical protein
MFSCNWGINPVGDSMLIAQFIYYNTEAGAGVIC